MSAGGRCCCEGEGGSSLSGGGSTHADVAVAALGSGAKLAQLKCGPAPETPSNFN